MKVPDSLRRCAEIYEARNLLYGDNYKRFGAIMQLLFPKGIELVSPSDFNRMGVFVQIVSKVTRYAEQFKNGGHRDSLDDAAVYAQMLAELDEDLAKEKASKQEEEGLGYHIDTAVRHRDNRPNHQ